MSYYFSVSYLLQQFHNVKPKGNEPHVALNLLFCFSCTMLWESQTVTRTHIHSHLHKNVQITTKFQRLVCFKGLVGGTLTPLIIIMVLSIKLRLQRTISTYLLTPNLILNGIIFHKSRTWCTNKMYWSISPQGKKCLVLRFHHPETSVRLS